MKTKNLIPATMTATVASFVLFSLAPTIHARGSDDSATHEANDDHGRNRGSDDPVADDHAGRDTSGRNQHDVNDDDVVTGIDDPANHDLGDDRRPAADDLPNHERQESPDAATTRGGKRGRDDGPNHR